MFIARGAASHVSLAPLADVLYTNNVIYFYVHMKKYRMAVSALALSLMMLGAGCGNKNTAPAAVSDASNDPTLSLPSVQVEQGAQITAKPVGKTEVKSEVMSTLKYMDALKIYAANSMRFQFSDCSGRPGYLTMKVGTKFMLDNRDGEAHTIGIGSKTYQLPTYAFAIVSIPKAGDYNITCDGGGSAHVNVQN